MLDDSGSDDNLDVHPVSNLVPDGFTAPLEPRVDTTSSCA